jgi:hypothetical protein
MWAALLIRTGPLLNTTKCLATIWAILGCQCRFCHKENAENAEIFVDAKMLIFLKLDQKSLQIKRDRLFSI